MLGKQRPNYIIFYRIQYLLLKKLFNKSHVRPALNGASLKPDKGMARDLGRPTRFNHPV